MNTFGRTLFPYFLLITFMAIAGNLIGSIGKWGLDLAVPLYFIDLYHHFFWAPPFFFALILFLFRKVHYRTFFHGTLLGTSFLLLLAFARSEVFLIFERIIPQLFFILSWAYTNQHFQLNQGKKFYFFLFFFTSCALFPLQTMTPFLQTVWASKISPSLLIQIGSLLALSLLFCIWKYENWIRQKKRSPPDKIIYLTFSRYRALLSFTVLLIGLSSMANLFSPIFLTHFTEAFSGAELSFSSFLKPPFFFYEILGALLLTWLGPTIIRSYGWKTAYLGGILVTLIILVALCLQNPTEEKKTALLLRLSIGSIQLLWIFPLMQIAFLSISSKYRFHFQLIIWLVFAPLLKTLFSWAWKYFHSLLIPTSDYYSSIGVALSILFVMYLCLEMITKKSTGLKK